MNKEMLDKYFENMQSENQKSRVKEIHASSLATCGYKYKMDYNNDIEFTYKFIFGLGWEEKISTAVRFIDGSFMEQYEMKAKISGITVVAHTDLFSMEKREIIEIKSTTGYSDNSDIYLNQLKMYMYMASIVYSESFKGLLWVYNARTDEFKEIEVNMLSFDDMSKINNNVMAFIDNKYAPRIESSLCKFCDVFTCIANKNKYKNGGGKE